MNYKILFSRSVAQSLSRSVAQSLSRLPIRACSLIIFLFLTSCQKNNDASDLHAEQKVQKFSPEVESSIANIVAIVSQNSNSIKAMYRSSNDGVSLRNGDFDEVTQETESGLRQFQKDPNSLLRQIAAEAQGAEKIALIEGLMSIKDAETLRKLYAPFGTIDDMPNLRGNLPNELQLRSCPLDCRLHWMAGASIAIGVGTLAYLTLGRLSFTAKIVVCAAIGVAMGIFAGHLREAANERANQGSYSWRDFRNTMWGSVSGGAIAWGIMKLPLSRTATWISMGVLTAVIGYCPAVTIATGNTPGGC